jgi:hypothetical protein
MALEPSGSPADPTELAGISSSATELSYAWSDAEPAEVVSYRPRRTVAMAVGAALVLIAAAGGVAVWQVRDAQPRPTAAQITSTTVPAEPAAEELSPQPRPQAAPPPPPPTRSQPPAPVTLPARAGSAYVKSRSGKTVCHVSAGQVECNVAFTVPTPTFDYGRPATGVAVTARGDWQWLVGDPGDPDYETLMYDTVYRALGWTITPTSEGTTFMNDATGRGMTVSVEGFQPF